MIDMWCYMWYKYEYGVRAGVCVEANNGLCDLENS